LTAGSPPTAIGDVEVARRAARAAGEVARRHRGGPLEVRLKSAVPTDVVTVADREAEAAAVVVLGRLRPSDGVLGEEGADVAASGDRRWVVDAIDGTLNYALGLGAWCSAVVLADGDGPLACAVFDPERDELFSAARGGGAWLDGRALAVRDAVALDRAAIACQWGFGKLELPGARRVVGRIVEEVGAVRVAGAGTLELCWVAAGRLHGWMQPAPASWDWLPGALLVREAGGGAVTVDDAEVGWSLAGHPDTVDALRALLV
jgi:myo-inositol-1(or 4)-monophosphatase